jgi:acetyl esterase/lipase
VLYDLVVALSRISKLVGKTAGLVDRAFTYQLQNRVAPSARAVPLSHAERLERLAAIRESYAGGLEGDPSRFFPEPPKVEISLRQVRRGVWDATWTTAFDTYVPSISEKYHSRIPNRTARARLFLASAPESTTKRPAIVAIHGYMGGHYLFEENVWPIEWFVRRGLDVALPVLPQHAGRGGARKGPPSFPSADPRMTIEGFRQAVCDVRTIMAFLRGRGAPNVGVTGMSLGGYTASLLATVTRDVDFVMPMIPLVSIADFVRELGRLGPGEEGHEQSAALEKANWVISPLARPLLVPKERAFVFGAEFDRVTPISHAQRLAEHFDCEFMTMAGAHLLQVGRSAGFRAFGKMLERNGIIPPRR